MRAIEIADNGDDTLSVFGTMADSGAADDRNVELLLPTLWGFAI